MNTHDLTSRAGDRPVTRDDLIRDLKTLGVRQGDTLLVNSSLAALGWVNGGPQAVVEALQRAVGDNGTLIMPTFSRDWSDPATWRHPPVPVDWWQTIRDTLPPYDEDLTPTHLGAIPECFRKGKGVLRSRHPQYSFAAWGKNAEFVIADHDIGERLGYQSPLGRLYELDGSVLLLGVGFEKNTSGHLAEYMKDYPNWPRQRHLVPVSDNGRNRWVECQDVVLTPDDMSAFGFQQADVPAIQEEYAARDSRFLRGQVGHGVAILFPHRPIVNFLAEQLADITGRSCER